MVDRLAELEEAWRRRTESASTALPSLISGGGGGTSDGMEARVKRLEEDMKEIKGDLKTLLRDAAGINGKLDRMPSAFEFGQLKGRVDSLPTLAKIGTLIGFATAAIVILNNWSAIKTATIG